MGYREGETAGWPCEGKAISSGTTSERVHILRTLIVEDNARFRQSLKEMLEARFPKMTILEAGDGEEALRQVAAFRPSLIFMDIRLPGETGLELTKKIKSRSPEIFIVILTSYDLPEYRDVAAQCGANHFLVKGISTSDEIASVVHSFFPNREPQN